MYSDRVGNEIVVQIARVRGGEVECIDVRKPLVGATGVAKQKIVEEAKAEAQAIFLS